MIAASPHAYEPLDLIQLTLMLAIDNKYSISETLKKHFSEVLEQAVILTKNESDDFPKEGSWSPEAITLALMLRNNEDFGAVFDEQTSIDEIDPAVAAKLLSCMKTYVAA